MAKIETTIDRIRKFADLVGCPGKQEQGKGNDYAVKDFIINCQQGEIETYATDKASKIYVNVKIACKVDEVGKIVVGDIEAFQKILSAFDSTDNVVIENKDGFIRVNRAQPKKMAKLISIDERNVETAQVAETLHNLWKVETSSVHTERTKLETVLELKAESLKQVIVDSGLVNESKYPISVMKDSTGIWFVKADVGNAQLAEIKSLIPTTKIVAEEQINNVYAYGFENILNGLSGDITIYTKQAAPLWVVKKEEGMTAMFMITPIMDNV